MTPEDREAWRRLWLDATEAPLIGRPANSELFFWRFIGSTEELLGKHAPIVALAVISAAGRSDLNSMCIVAGFVTGALQLRPSTEDKERVILSVVRHVLRLRARFHGRGTDLTIREIAMLTRNLKCEPEISRGNPTGAAKKFVSDSRKRQLQRLCKELGVRVKDSRGRPRKV